MAREAKMVGSPKIVTSVMLSNDFQLQIQIKLA
jgi:hypothetical protein